MEQEKRKPLSRKNLLWVAGVGIPFAAVLGFGVAVCVVNPESAPGVFKDFAVFVKWFVPTCVLAKFAPAAWRDRAKDGK